MAGRVSATECPNCGAPLDPAALSHSDAPACSFCHYALPTESDPAPVVVNVNVESGRYAPGPTTTSGRSGRLGGIIVLIIILAIGGGITAVALGTKHSTLIGSGYSTANAQVVPVTPGAAGDFYVVAPKLGATDSEIVRRINPTARKVVWSSSVLDQSDAGIPQVVAAPSAAIAIFGTTVVALGPSSGRTLWQASLSNKLSSPCDSGCAVVDGQRLVTLAANGTVQAFDLASGAQRWSIRLNSTPRWLERAGSSVLVDQTASSDGPGLAVLDIDAATGRARTLMPTCPPGPDIPLTASPTDERGFFVSPDGSTLTVLVTTSGGCSLGYRIADGSMLWRTATEEHNAQVPFTLTGESTAEGNSALLWTNDDGVFAQDWASGTIRRVLTIPKNQSFRLLGVIGSTVIASQALESQTYSPATVGIDLASGAPRWQVATTVSRSGDTQDVIVTATNPVVVTCNSTAGTCRFAAVDPTTGTIAGISTVQADPGQVDEIRATTTASSIEAVVGWDHIVGFNPANAAVQWRWPS